MHSQAPDRPPFARPNLLLIMTDQHRGDCLGAAGHPCVQTPHLDALARGGCRFTHAYAPVPSCIPARASLMTGMNATATGITGMGPHEKRMHDTFPSTLPRELGRAGYHCQAVGHMHFEPPRATLGFDAVYLDEPMPDTDYTRWLAEQSGGRIDPLSHSPGWNAWAPSPWPHDPALHPVCWTTDQAIRCFEQRPPDRPWFLKVSYFRPHSPYDPPPAYLDRYRDAPIPPALRGQWSQRFAGPLADDAWCGAMSDAQLRDMRAAYYASVSFVDEQIGRLLSELRRRDPQALERTWILFISDHGDQLGDHHLYRKSFAYESSLRVPMIVRPPRAWAGALPSTCDALVEMQDVMPSLLSFAGLPTPGHCTGLSVLPWLQGDVRPRWRDYVHAEHSPCYSKDVAHHTLTDGREKYVWLPFAPGEQLFDLQQDPGETRDLAPLPQSAARLDHWRRELRRLLGERATDWSAQPLPAFLQEAQAT